MALELNKSRRLSQAILSEATSFYHNDIDRLRSVNSPAKGSSRKCSIDAQIQAESACEGERCWADTINDVPFNPAVYPLLKDEDSSRSKRTVLSDDLILLEGELRKAGKSEKEVGLRARYFYLTKKFLSYHVKPNTPARGRVYFDDVVGLVTRDETVFRQTADLDWEQERAKQHDLRQTDFVLVTSRIGFERGRQYLIRAPSKAERQLWTICIRDIMDHYKDREVAAISTFLFLRRRVRSFYFCDHCQIFIGVLIMLNFALNIVEAQFTLVPNDNPIALVFQNADLVFTALFTAELVVNLFSTLVKSFIQDAWNFFDLAVVAVSLLALGMPNMPAAGPLRLLRCFRVFRLFKRIKALRQLIVALGSSIPPMLNAFALVCLITSIYSLMAATFFSRDLPEEFGDFFSSLFTMFQVMTADAWSDLARTLFATTGNPAAVAAFFVSFQVISSLVLLNVVIAVLLDEFNKAAESNEKQPGPAASRERGGSLERIAGALARYRDRLDLDARVDDLFSHIVAGGRPGYRGRRPLTQRLEFEETERGLRALGFLPPIVLTAREWADMAVYDAVSKGAGAGGGPGASACESAGLGAAVGNGEKEEWTLGVEELRRVVRQSLWRRTLRLLRATAEGETREWDADSVALALQSAKGVLMYDSLACPAGSALAAPCTENGVCLGYLPEEEEPNSHRHGREAARDPRLGAQMRVLLATLDEAARRVAALERLFSSTSEDAGPGPSLGTDSERPVESGAPRHANGGREEESGSRTHGKCGTAACAPPAVAADHSAAAYPSHPSMEHGAAAARAAALRRRLAERLAKLELEEGLAQESSARTSSGKDTGRRRAEPTADSASVQARPSAAGDETAGPLLGTGLQNPPMVQHQPLPAGARRDSWEGGLWGLVGGLAGWEAQAEMGDGAGAALHATDRH